MNYIDLLILLIFIVAGFKGFKTGLVRQVASLLGLVLGIWGAIHFSSFTASLLIENLSLTSQYLPLISFALTFLAILVGVHFLGILVDKVFDLAMLGFANRLMGVVFGLVKNILILSIIITIVERFNDLVKFIPDDLEKNSVFYGPIRRVAPAIYPYLNFEEIQQQVLDTFSSAQE